ncbi:L-threonylcarbamoyladenylate synthase [Roseospirillum parvum]|uniref:L-threonylcarbamoyladenylate synthase n=1 Tax=Roseospirillum parvum TaxID=83401 RepID=UPI001FDF6529|nr:L-threonylcarbamoyladenylate synthase [Roseospirillum parvum]
MAAVRPADAAAIAAAGALLAAGRLVAFPTETVYGLAADATNDRAVAAIFAAKGRPRFNPLIVHLAAADQAAALARVDDRAARLMAAFWPGPLTLVLPRRPEGPLSPLVSAGLPTVALRVPAGPVAGPLIHAAGRPLAAPSANRSGYLSPTTAAHVAADLEMGPGADQVAMVLDGGPTSVGLESTVLDLTGPTPALLRPGGLDPDALAEVLGAPVAVAAPPADPEAPTAPGQLASHYAPRRPLRLNATEARPGEALLGFAGTPGALADLSPAGDLVEAAANLFRRLHELDAGPHAALAVAPIPERGLGIAINDRLRRAAAPREETR